MKKCSKCLRRLPLGDFFKDSRGRGDGLESRCKGCRRAAFLENRRKRSEYYKEYEKKRARTPKRRELNTRCVTEFRKNQPVAYRSSVEKMRLKYPEKFKARYVVNNAIKSGKLIKPTACSRCEQVTESRKLHAHHRDYSRPLDVVWLCFRCHLSHEHYPY